MALKTIVILFFCINTAAYLSMMMDKWFAIKHKWRLSEAFLLGYAFFGGGLGILMGMVSFRHKLSKVKFRMISPIGILVYLGIFIYFVFVDKIIFI